jgi:hypothetical protein
MCICDIGKTGNSIGASSRIAQKNHARQLRLPKLLKSFAYLRQRVGSPDQHNDYDNAYGNS